MRIWLLSVIAAIVSVGLFWKIGATLNHDSYIWTFAGLLLWLCLGFLFPKDTKEEADDEFGKREKNPLDTLSAKQTLGSIDDHSLKDAVVTLTQQLRSKENIIGKMQGALTEREFRRSLSRLASINETLSFTVKLLESGKLNHSDAIEQLRLEIESAVGDLGLEHHSIQIGTAVSTLPPGSFVILRSEAPPETAKAGTVREVVSSGLYVKDEDGRLHFISPSKINVYKL